MGLPFLKHYDYICENISFMKRLVVFFLFVITVVACNGLQKGACVIEGRIDDPEYDKMYLVDFSGNQLDSASRKNDGSFRFVYKELMPRVVVMEFRSESDETGVLYLPVALESGKVKVALGEYIHLSGSPLNNTIKRFFDEMQALVDGFEEISTVEAQKNAYSAFYLKKMQENEDNPFGAYLKLAYLNKLTQQDLQTLLAD